MNWLRILKIKSKLFYLFLIMLALFSSITNMCILILINATIGGQIIPHVNNYKPELFVALILISFISTRFFQHFIIAISNSVLFELELSLIRKVQSADFEAFQAMGPEKIYAAISDTRMLSRVPEVFVILINAFITLGCSLGYLFWLSPTGGFVVLILMSNLLFLYVARNEIIEKRLNLLRDLQNSYFKSLQELLFAFKQIKVSAIRNKNIYESYILFNRQKAKDLSVSTSKAYVFNQLVGVYSWYILFGVILFILPVVLQLQMVEISVFITSVLFMMSPISQILSFVSFHTSSKIAFERINKIYKDLEVVESDNNVTASSLSKFDSIRFEAIVYRHLNQEGDSFSLQFDDLEIKQGEIVFITGSNGSGKSTFLNIFLGLYEPTQGSVYIDDKKISWTDFVSFNSQMSVVFADHHLFRENYDGHDLSEDNEELKTYQHMLNLDGVLRFDATMNHIHTELSKGQQKRLALLLNLLEDKPIIILDEWAAEQDPQNRNFFYTKWLFELKAMGKTIIAISHDNDYYYLADRLITFKNGRLVENIVKVKETIS